MVAWRFVAGVYMRQINLYRNVLIASERKRKMAIVSVFTIAVVGALIWAGAQVVSRDLVRLEDELGAIGDRIQTEKELVEALGAEAKKRKEKEVGPAKHDVSTSLANLIARRGDVDQISTLLNNWVGKNANLSHLLLDKDQMVITGRAQTRVAAMSAMNEMRDAFVSLDWRVVKGEIKSASDFGVDFTLTVRRKNMPEASK